MKQLYVLILSVLLGACASVPVPEPAKPELSEVPNAVAAATVAEPVAEKAETKAEAEDTTTFNQFMREHVAERAGYENGLKDAYYVLVSAEREHILSGKAQCYVLPHFKTMKFKAAIVESRRKEAGHGNR